jgi:hypothetical protein
MAERSSPVHTPVTPCSRSRRRSVLHLPNKSIVGVACVVASVGCASKVQQTPSVVTPVADVKQIMNGLTVPASDLVFKAVSTVMSAGVVKEIAPRTDEDWQRVEDGAAMLVESGNLLMIGKRVDDQGDWIPLTQAFVAASRQALEAARIRKQDALESSFDAIYESCERCHLKYFK